MPLKLIPLHLNAASIQYTHIHARTLKSFVGTYLRGELTCCCRLWFIHRCCSPFIYCSGKFEFSKFFKAIFTHIRLFEGCYCFTHTHTLIRIALMKFIFYMLESGPFSRAHHNILKFFVSQKLYSSKQTVILDYFDYDGSTIAMMMMVVVLS